MDRLVKRKAIRQVYEATKNNSLTSREQEVLDLIWAGFTNKEMACQLKISVKTIETHRNSMMKKMRVSNTAELLRTALGRAMIGIRAA
jgi:DNA-binding NarL/FixJ family response regulator